MITPLIISRTYCFKHSPGGECLRAFVGAMNGNDWNPIVYASDRQSVGEPKMNNTRFVHEKRHVKYIAAAIRRVLIPDLTYLPDYEWTAWSRNAGETIIRDIKKKVVVPDYIHSVSFPSSCHWAAIKVKQATGLPLVMQFYDPWADNPYRKFKTKWMKKKDWAMERKVVESADIIIHDNETIAQLWRERYGEEMGQKIVVLPLTVPLPNVKVLPSNHKDGDTITITHIGNFMLNRTAQPFISALELLFNKHPELRAKIKVVFIGKVTDSDREQIQKNGFGDIFNLLGILPAADCVRYYQEADIFLAVDGVNRDNLFFPSKILKYFYFQRPILGISPNGSVLHSELKESHHFVYDNSDCNGIAEFLYRAITNYKSTINFDKDYWHRFEPQNVVEQYREIICYRLVKSCS